MFRWIFLGLWALFLMPVTAAYFTADGYVAHASHDGQSAEEFPDSSGSD